VLGLSEPSGETVLEDKVEELRGNPVIGELQLLQYKF
jgi:hypothetical protein